MFKIKVKNKMYLFVITFVVVAIAMFSINSNYGVINHFFEYFMRPDFQKSEFALYGFISSTNEKYGPFKAWAMQMKIFVRTIEGLFVWALELFQILLPIISGVSAFVVYNKRKTIESFILVRKKNYRRYVLKNVFLNSLYCAISFFVGFLIIWVANHFLYTHGIDPEHPGRSMLADIVGKDLLMTNTFLYFLLEGSVRFFFMPFVYSFFASSCAYAVSKEWKAYLIPNLYYFLLSLVGFIVLLGNSEFSKKAIYWIPTVIMASGDYEFATIPMILTNSLPIFIGLGIILFTTRKIEL